MTQAETDSTAEQRYRRLAELGADAGVQPIIDALFDDSWRVRRLAAERLGAMEPTETVVPALVDVLARGDTGARNAAATALPHLGPRAVPALVTLLASPEPDQRKLAAEILGAIGDASATPALVSTLADRDLNVRLAAIEALGSTGGPLAAPALVNALAGAEPLLQVGALEALRSLDTAPPLPALVSLLSAPSTRRSAWLLLGHVRHRAALGLIVRALRSPATRELAVLALGGSLAPLPDDIERELSMALHDTDTVTTWLASCLSADDRPRRIGALQVVAALDLTALAPQVAAASEGFGLGPLCLRVLGSLGIAGAEVLLRGTPTLSELSWEARVIASEAIIDCAGPRLVPPLIALLRDGEPELSEFAVRALGMSASVDAVAPVIKALDSPPLASVAEVAITQLATHFPAQVRAELATRLTGKLTPELVTAWARTGGAEAREVLRRALHDASAEVRAAGAQVAALDEATAASLLSMALVDEAPGVRRATARALGKLGPSARPTLDRLLTDRDATVLAEATRAALTLEASWAVPRLLELVRHTDAGVAVGATHALLGLGAPTHTFLEVALTHLDPEVVKVALLEAAELPPVIEAARRLISSHRWDVRAAAASVLAVSGSEGDRVLLAEASRHESEPLAAHAIDAALATLDGRAGQWQS